MVDSGYSKTSYIYNLGFAFDRAVDAYGDRVALKYPDGTTVTYSRLHEISNKLANYFVIRGISKGDVVAIFSNKSLESFASMLACTKVGAIYANLDVTSPPDRLIKMLDTCQPVICLFDRGVESIPHGIRKLGIATMQLYGSDFEQVLAEISPEIPCECSHVTGADAAYIMFTSGSTGSPKGAVMSHGNLLNFIAWSRSTFGIGPGAVLTNLNPIYFDNSVFDFYSSLFTGGTMCPISADLVRKPRQLVETVSKLGCTIWFSVPSLLVYLLTMKAICENDFSDLKLMIFGGEGFPKSKLKDLDRLIGCRVNLMNVYGPTECTCICSAHEISSHDVADQTQLAPLGHIAPNFGYRIDPIDSTDSRFGELLLYGPNVGLGYYNDPKRTRDAFIDVQDDTGYRLHLYRTGDLVRETQDGTLRFCGRVDNQIKHMGYRIELEEIEAAFAQIGGVNEAGVVYKSFGDGTGKIVAVISCDASLLENDVRMRLEELLPPYMLPSQICYLDELPKNRTGKIDRVTLMSKVK